MKMGKKTGKREPETKNKGDKKANRMKDKARLLACTEICECVY